MKIGGVVRLAEDLNGQNRPNGRCPSYGEIRDVARRMEEAGFDVLWFADHLLYRYENQPTMGIWECWTILSALAESTQRIELGTSTLCASFRNPAVLAKMAATLDEVSGGRLILGLGAGWNEPEYRAFGLPFERRVDRFEEALQIIVPLLRTGRVDFEGHYYSARDCELSPRGPRASGPPILIGSLQPRMTRLAARFADIWNPVEYLSGAGRFLELRERFDAARAALGEAAAPDVQVSAMLKVGWADLGELPGFFDGDCVTGSAEQVAQTFHDFETAGVDHVLCQYHPSTSAVLDRLIAGVEQYRRLSANS
ncbi:MAG TPA: LLM class flavin-dependent oxidoreductase [Chloroflexota bacterium]|jgi:probable F420-dependent oxidoreductase